MNAQEVMSTLRKLGNPQRAAIYKRHGSGDDVFGVLTSEIDRLRKRIKVDHALAMELWETGNGEARILALQIADPERLTRADATRFLNDGAPGLAWYLSALVARSPVSEQMMRTWMKSPKEYTREMGYGVLCARLKDDPDAITDDAADAILITIEKEIHRSANRARYAMNAALIAIGIHKPGLRQKALDAGRRIGKVEVDHGETYCKTPDACAYIEKAAKPKVRP